MNNTSTSNNMAKIPGNSVEFLEKICMQKLEEYFPAGIPVDAGSKIQYELSKIKEQHTEDIYRVYYEFQKIAEKENKFINGLASTGNLFLTFLLGNSPFDPLPTYYYCESCGYYETIDELTNEPICPKCGKPLFVRGYNLPDIFEFGMESEPRVRGSFEYRCEPGSQEILFNKLCELYANNQVVCVLDTDKKSVVGFAVLPDGKSLSKDYPELMIKDDDGNEMLYGDIAVFNSNGFIRMVAIEIPGYEAFGKNSEIISAKSMLMQKCKNAPFKYSREILYKYLIDNGVSSEGAYDIINGLKFKCDAESKINEYKRIYEMSDDVWNKITDLSQEAYENHGYLPMMIGSLHIEWINYFINKGEKSE